MKAKIKTRAGLKHPKKRRASRQKSRVPSKTKSKKLYGLGSEIAAIFKGVGFKEREIKELRGFEIQVPDFVE